MMRLFSGVLFLLLSSCMRIYVYEGPPPRPRAETQKEKKKEKPSRYKPWAKAVKDATEQEGFLTTYLKPDQTLLVAVPKDLLGKDFALVMHVERGVGDLNLLEGLPFSGTQLLTFERRGDYVLLVRKNPRFTAGGEKAAEHALRENVGHVVIGRFKIQSEHSETGALLVDLTSFLLSYPDFSRYRFLFDGGSPGVIRDLSFVDRVLNFPENTEISVTYTLRLPGRPRWGGESLVDRKRVTMALRWSFFALPEQPMIPRFADERVGYFLTTVEDFSRDTSLYPFRHMIQRWRLEPEDPRLPVSRPKKPIVFYLDRTIPQRYRKYVREAIEEWNKAFEKAGFRNAIVVKDAPEDSTWSPEDIRYSTIRWTFAHRMGYATGPSQVDPRTGEILNADILLDWSFIRGWVLDFDATVDPLSLVQEAEKLRKLQEVLGTEHLCTFMLGMKTQLAMAYLNLLATGRIRPGEPLPEEYIGAAIKDIVLHEVGHTLGLRHNFKASSVYSFESLKDSSFTRQYGTAASVMDYIPLNLMADPPQGDYFMTTLGPYDYHAIHYGYAPVKVKKGHVREMVTDPWKELDTLRVWARRTDATLAFGTDEEAGSLGPDPYTARWDLSSDPLEFARNRRKVAEKIFPRLEELFLRGPEGYRALRIAFGVLWSDRYYAYSRLVKYIGGLRMDRVKPEDGLPPFRPVPAALQREALEEILKGIFPRELPELAGNRLLNMAPNFFDTWARPMEPPYEFSPMRSLGTIYAYYLSELFHPARMNRLVTYRYITPDPLTPDEVMDRVERHLFGDLSDLPPHLMVAQDLYLRGLAQLAYGSNGFSTPPSPEVRALARAHLKSLVRTLREGARKASDPALQAHLDYLADFAEKALNLQIQMSLPGFASWYDPGQF